MARNITAEMDAELLKARKYPFFLVKIQTSGGDLRVTTGYGNLTFNSEVYLGVGRFGGVGEIEESSNLQPNGTTFSLSGIPPSYISIALGQIRQGLEAFLWLGFWNPDTKQVVNAPYQLFRGITNIPILNESKTSAKISIECENRLARLKIPKVLSYTTEDQKLIDPTDIGFFQVAALQEFTFSFGPRDNDEANLNIETQ
jgi:hypothetical protein